MSNHKLDAQNTKKLIDAIDCLLSFCVNFEVNPMVSMHLHQAVMHLESQLPKKMKIPVLICMTPEGFDSFIKNVMIRKPVPINSFHKKGK
jgi:hypothetical protein